MPPLKTDTPGSRFDLRSVLRTARWYFITRVRGAFEDVAYIALLVTSVLLYNLLLGFLNDQISVPLASRLHAAAEGIFFWSVLYLPTILILAVALRLAPPQGARRWAWATGAAILGALWGNRCAVLVYHLNPAFDHISQGLVSFWLVCVGCFLHNTGRRTEAALFRAELDSTALAAEFDRAQLELLRAQVEPHFLFNTLATVRILAYTEPRTAALLVESLLRYLTAALPKLRKADTSLEEETELIEAYLQIQQVRMGARLSYHVRIPESLKHLRVPSVMLLTLVENAIKHGVGPVAGGGCVSVGAAQEGATLILTVIDDGLGMQAQSGYGSGLASIRARLALHYKERASLSLESATPCGVMATIKIPLDAMA
ncbi:MAG TPA: histidine kinase [Steroidobacteraceae bacterium]|nr:histidine kinase [Steroidobacteraceae bacterium]